MGRIAEGDRPKTSAERQRAYRARKASAAFVEKPKKEAKPRQRKQRSDSVAAAVKAMDNAQLPPLMPPVMMRLPESAMVYWHSIIESRARDEWTPADLISAANLAKCQGQIQDEELLLEHEERVTMDIFGKMIVNPRFTVVETLNKRVFALMRSLRMGGKPAGELKQFANGKVVEGESRDVSRTADESDGLLA